MANICEYDVRAKGSKKATTMVIYSMPSYEGVDVYKEEKVGNKYYVGFTGTCPWSVDYGTVDFLDKIDLSKMTDDKIVEKALEWDANNYSLRAKSEALQCEIMVRYWEPEAGFDSFNYYKNGKLIKQRRIPYDDSNVFDWTAMEYGGHAGEYNNNLNEDFGTDVMNKLKLFSALNQITTGAEDEEIDISKLLAALEGCVSALEKFTENLPDNTDADSAEKGCPDDINIFEKADSKKPKQIKDRDIYSWSFDEKKRKDKKQWSIIIPNGFKTVKSSEGRLLEAIPCNTKQGNAPITIFASNGTASAIDKKEWFYHPYALEALGEAKIMDIMKNIQPTFNVSMDVFGIGFDGKVGCLLVVPCTNNAYSYQAVVVTDNKSQLFSVQTESLTDGQKAQLTDSILNWLKTFKFDKRNSTVGKLPIFEKNKTFKDLLANDATYFNETVDRAKIEFEYFMTQKLKTLKHKANNGFVADDINERINEIIMRGMELKEYYLREADKLIDKLKDKNIDNRILKKHYKKLNEFETWSDEFKYGRKKIKVTDTDFITGLYEKWHTGFREASDAVREKNKKMKMLKVEAEARHKSTEMQLSDYYAVREDFKEHKERFAALLSKQKTLRNIVESYPSVKKEFDKNNSEMPKKISGLKAQISNLDSEYNEKNSEYQIKIDEAKKAVDVARAEENSAKAEYTTIQKSADELKAIADKSFFFKRKKLAAYSQALDEANKKKSVFNSVKHKYIMIKNKENVLTEQFEAFDKAHTESRRNLENELANCEKKAELLLQKFADDTAEYEYAKKESEKVALETDSINRELAILEGEYKKQKEATSYLRLINGLNNMILAKL